MQVVRSIQQAWMIHYIVSRIFQTLLVIFGVSVIAFTVLHLTPGDPAEFFAGEGAPASLVAEIRHQMGLDRPLHVQYFVWISDVIRGDLGKSLLDGRPVLPTILSRMPATLQLVTGAMLVAIVIGIPAGVMAAVKRNSVADSVSRVFALLGVSMPSFWQGLVLILLFAYYLRIFPVGGSGSILHLVLPAVTLGTGMAALIMRLTRSTMLGVLREDYVRTARAKGIAEQRVIFKHALRNAALPVVTAVGLQVGYLLGGAVIVETLFVWPGIGQFAYIRMIQRDYPMIMGNLVVFSTFFSLVNLLTDLSYAWLDPRIKYQ